MLVSCLPDTDCTQTIISAALANQLGVHINTSAAVQLLTANGEPMNVLSQTQLYMQQQQPLLLLHRRFLTLL